MKQILYMLYGICLLLSSASSFGQNADSKESKSVKIQVIRPQGLDKQDGAISLLEERLTQAVILNGIASTTSRFLLVTSIRELSSQVTPSTPPRYVTELEVSCYIADQTEKTVLQQTTFNVKGTGSSKTKAYRNATGMLQARNPRLKTLINKGKEKIIAYYRIRNEESLKRENDGTNIPDTEWIFNDQP